MDSVYGDGLLRWFTFSVMIEVRFRFNLLTIRARVRAMFRVRFGYSVRV